jgi:hypothetical protein
MQKLCKTNARQYAKIANAQTNAKTHVKQYVIKTLKNAISRMRENCETNAKHFEIVLFPHICRIMGRKC